jgi:hypothetical protein
LDKLEKPREKTQQELKNMSSLKIIKQQNEDPQNKQNNRIQIYEGKWRLGLPVMYSNDVIDIKNFKNFKFKSIFNDNFDLIWDHNGNVYCGERNPYGKFTGKGVCKYQLGYVYFGDFVNNLWDGQGKLYNNEGIVYKGQFRKSTFQGTGVIYFRNGAKYRGEFVKGEMEGKGVMEYSDERKYDGMFHKSVKDGPGVWNYLDGSIMETIYKEGRIEGDAVHIREDPNGKKEFVLRKYLDGKLVSQKKFGKRPRNHKGCCRVF